MDTPDKFAALASEFEQIRRLRLEAAKDGMPAPMAGMATVLLNALHNSAQDGAPLVRVCDITKGLPMECEILLMDTVEVLKMQGDIVERDHGDTAIGITEAVLQAEKERLDWMSSRDGKVEAALAEAAKEVHPNWVKRARKVDDKTREAAEKGDRFAEMLVNTVSWTIADPLNTPVSPAALADWFEKTHPAEAKRIRAEIVGAQP